MWAVGNLEWTADRVTGFGANLHYGHREVLWPAWWHYFLFVPRTGL